jgi:uncharacterized membrane protein YfcA
VYGGPKVLVYPCAQGRLSSGRSRLLRFPRGFSVPTSLAVYGLWSHPWLLLYAAVVVFAAFYVRAVIGFGSGLISVAFLSLLFPIKEVVPVVLLLDLLGSFVLGTYDFREIRWPELRWLVPGSLAGLVVGSFILADSDAQRLTFFLGVFILAYVFYAIALRPERLPRVGLAWGLPLGLLGGVVGSLYGGGGPPLVAFLQMRHLDKRAFRATFQGIALTDNIARMIIYIGLALLSLPLAGGALLLTLPVLGGLWAGNHLHFRINERMFLRATLLVLTAVGIKYLI